jgi:RNA polymerase sigma factor (TIGR02999 family)
MAAGSGQEITQLLLAWRGGDATALDRLAPIVYDELRRIARRYMAQEQPGHTLQATALVNEAYLRLIDCSRMHWRDRTHFFAMSSQLIRRILIDHARQHNYKRGAGLTRISLDEIDALAVERAADLIALDDALNALMAMDPRKSRIVELRFFGGLSVEETAEALHISTITVIRDWNTAKAWLFREISKRSADET